MTRSAPANARLLRGAKTDSIGSDIRFPFFAREAGYTLMGDPDVRPQHMLNYPLAVEDHMAQDADNLAKAAALLHSMARNHPFADGNKRTAVTAEPDRMLADLGLGAPSAGGDCFTGNDFSTSQPPAIELLYPCNGLAPFPGGGGWMSPTYGSLTRYLAVLGGQAPGGDWRTQPAPPAQPQMEGDPKQAPPVIAIGFGTATTFVAVSAQGDIEGVAIAPGIATSGDSLFRATSTLPQVALAKPQSAIGKNTIQSMQSGFVFGFTGLVKELVERIQAELGGNAHVIATGGLATFTGKLAAAAGTTVAGTTYLGAAQPNGTKWWQGWTVYARN